MASPKGSQSPRSQDVPAAITLRLEGGYVVAKCGQAFAVFELVWEARHGDAHKHLVLRECPEIPRQFESEAYARTAQQDRVSK